MEKNSMLEKLRDFKDRTDRRIDELRNEFNSDNSPFREFFNVSGAGLAKKLIVWECVGECLSECIREVEQAFKAGRDPLEAVQEVKKEVEKEIHRRISSLSGNSSISGSVEIIELQGYSSWVSSQHIFGYDEVEEIVKKG